MFAATSNATTYHAGGICPAQAVVSQMRIASTEYPDQIRTKYLQLHFHGACALRQLAQDLHNRSPTLTIAPAIEEYLRLIHMTLEVPAPPEWTGRCRLLPV